MKTHEMHYGKELYYHAVNKLSMHDRAVLCISPEEWKDMAENSAVNVPSKYMLAYISKPDKKKRKAVQFYRGKLEMECFNVVDGSYAENKKMLDLRNTLPEMSLKDFVKYFANADFIITDEHYSLCLAVVLNKPFIYFGDDDKTADILTELQLNERVVFDTEHFPVNNRLLQPVNFDFANKVVSEKKADWLKHEEIAKPVDRAVTSVLDLNLCVGCSACVNVCPKGALTLKPDKYGYYCTSIEPAKCIIRS